MSDRPYDVPDSSSVEAHPAPAPSIEARGAAREPGIDPRMPAVAIVGLACRLPGAPDSARFWQNLRAGVCSIRTLTDAQLRANGVRQEDLESPSYVRACALLEDVDKFDAAYFGLSPREASVMDPAHRFFLEVAHHALEHAGHAGGVPESAVGVFASSGAPTYLHENLHENPDVMRSVGAFLVRHSGNDMNFLATRVSYALDLRGPSLNVQTACSSSLVAVHLACQSLARGECDLALAGGSTILLPMGQGYTYAEGEVLSPDGRCRPFDEAAAGTVFGSGAGCVALKLLSRALDDGDTIHAVIRGSAVNNDGALKVGYLAPGVEGQAGAITAALRAAGVDPRSISYVEAHGTGTRVGDPIEVAALREALGGASIAGPDCVLGSVKGNIGHLGEAAGIASLIKAVLALGRRELPGTLGYERPNPQLELAQTRFHVQAEHTPWHGPRPLRCGVAALGVGGTNCHLILEDAPEPVPGEGARPLQLLMLSAKEAEPLGQLADALATWLVEPNARMEPRAAPAELADVAYTLALGRRAHPLRRALVVRDRDDAARQLRAPGAEARQGVRAEERAAGVVFMFPGAGPQYRGMGAELYAHERAYREALDDAIAVAEAKLGSGALRALLTVRDAASAEPLARPSLALPALFAVEYALARMYLAWGVTPRVLIGHSMGEYVAACIAEVMTLAQAMQLVILRAHLSESVGAGGMLSVALDEAHLRALCDGLAERGPGHELGVSLAAVNAPMQCVVSGPLRAIEALEARLQTRGVDCARVPIGLAAHSACLDPVLPAFREACRAITLRAPTIPLISSLTGKLLSDDEARDPEYWVQHFRDTVRFSRGVSMLLGESSVPLAFLELGPGRSLATLVRAHGPRARHVVTSMRHVAEARAGAPTDDLAHALRAYGELWSAGVALDVEALYDGQLRNRVPLPGYPFARTRHWVEPVARAPSVSEPAARPPAAWFDQVVFREAPRLGLSRAPRRWLVLVDELALGRRLARGLPGEAYVVTPGKWMQRVGARHYELEPRLSAGYEELLAALLAASFVPEHVVYAFGATRSHRVGDALLRTPERALERALFGLTFLARALGRHGEPVQLSVLTHGIAEVDGGRLRPLAATALGPVLVTPREYPGVRTRLIDLAGPLRARGARTPIARVIDELLVEDAEQVVALRATTRWARALVPAPLPPVQRPLAWLRPDSVVLVTGGLGGLALEACLHMARGRSLKLALLARTPWRDPRDERHADVVEAREPTVAAGEPAVDERAARARKLAALRALGAEVLVVQGDVADRESMRRVLSEVRARFGRVDGVLHAAGVMDDELIETRSLPAMERVLAPKVAGTLVLDQLLSEPLDFFVIFSSVASLLGLPGQLDYTAANAFVDAFARARARRDAGKRRGITRVINWSAWREVGMTAAALRRERAGYEPTQVVAHPALDGWARTPSGGSVFVTTFSVARHWLLKEHRIRGAAPLLPGTAFVELARAAAAVAGLAGAVELSNVQFLSPFQVAPDGARRLRIALTPVGAGFELTMSTLDASSLARGAARFDAGRAREPAHVTADVRKLEPGAPLPLDLSALRARCGRALEEPRGGLLQQGPVELGPRWACVRRVHHGQGEALIELALPARFVDELAHYALHPALLDMATGGAQRLISGTDLERDFWVPLGYGSIRMHAPLAARLFSHVRYRRGDDPAIAYFDVTIADEHGNVRVAITRFTMKRLAAGARITTPLARVDDPERRVQSPLEVLLRTAISPSDGVEAFERIMAQDGLTQVVASSVDLSVWQRALAADAETARAESAPACAPQSASDERDHVAPESATERQLAGIWSDLLGVPRISVVADFFELGGSSLLAVRLFARIKKQFGVALPLSTLFEASSVRALADVLGDDAARPAAASTVRSTRIDGFTSLVAMQPKGTRPAFFCAAGMHGNPLNLRLLAALSGPDQPFFALQPQGLDGSLPLHRGVPEMAAHYVRELRRHQPHGPYYLGGYSGGGIIAFEMARQLVAARAEVGALVLLDSPAPSLPTRAPLERVKLHLARFGRRGPSYPARVAAQVLDAQLARARMLAQRRLARFFPALRFRYRLDQVVEAWLAAAACYRPDGYAGRALLLRAEALGSEVQGTSKVLDHQNGWGAYVFGGLEVRDVPGDHATMCEEPNVRVLARHLRAYLDRCISEREAMRRATLPRSSVAAE